MAQTSTITLCVEPNPNLSRNRFESDCVGIREKWDTCPDNNYLEHHPYNHLDNPYHDNHDIDVLIEIHRSYLRSTLYVHGDSAIDPSEHRIYDIASCVLDPDDLPLFHGNKPEKTGKPS